MAKAMEALVSSYSEKELDTPSDFLERLPFSGRTSVSSSSYDSRKREEIMPPVMLECFISVELL